MTAERKFLHDLASPLGTTMFLIDAHLETLRERAGADPAQQLQDIQQVEKIYAAVEKVRAILNARREALVQEAGSGGGGG